MKRTLILASLVLLVLPLEAQASETITYTYDALGRLTQVVHTGSVNNNLQSTYTFDAADNRTNLTVTNANSKVVVVPINGLTVIPIPDP